MPPASRLLSSTLAVTLVVAVVAVPPPAQAKAKRFTPASRPAGSADRKSPQADDTSPSAPKPEPSTTPPPPPRASPPASEPQASQSHRPILIGNLKFFSLGLPTSFNLGVGAGFNLWHIASVEADVQSGSQSIGAFGVNIGTLQQTLWGATARLYPLAGTFNILGAYGRRQLKAALDIGDVDLDTDVTVTQKVAALGLSNRWFVGRFFIGADWLVVHWPLGESTVESQLLGQQLDAEAEEEVDRAVDLMDGMPTVTLFNVHVGIGW